MACGHIASLFLDLNPAELARIPARVLPGTRRLNATHTGALNAESAS
jgi:hypothetical protein